MIDILLTTIRRTTKTLAKTLGVCLIFSSLTLGAGHANAQDEEGTMLQSPKTEQYLSIYGGGGLHSILFTPTDGYYLFGLGGLGGLQYQHFITPSWGVQGGLRLTWYNSGCKYNFTESVSGLTHPDNHWNYTANTTFENWKERQSIFAFGIPVEAVYQLQLGERWRVDFAAGFMFEFISSSSYTTEDGTYTTKGYFPNTNTEYSDLPKHGFTTTSSGVHGDFNTASMNISLVADAGGNYTISDMVSLYVGLYAGYGLTNITSDNNSTLYTPLSATTEPTYNSTFHSTQISGAHTLTFGAKIGVNFACSSIKKAIMQNIKPIQLDNDADKQSSSNVGKQASGTSSNKAKADKESKAKADKEAAAKQAKADKEAAAKQAKADKEAAAKQAKADKEAATKQAKADKEAATKQAKADKEAATKQAKADKDSGSKKDKTDKSNTASTKKTGKDTDGKKDTSSSAKTDKAANGTDKQSQQQQNTEKAEQSVTSKLASDNSKPVPDPTFEFTDNNAAQTAQTNMMMYIDMVKDYADGARYYADDKNNPEAYEAAKEAEVASRAAIEAALKGDFDNVMKAIEQSQQALDKARRATKIEKPKDTVVIIEEKKTEYISELENPNIILTVNFKLNGKNLEIDDESIQLLGNLADSLFENPKTKIRITGHTDNTGSAAANLRMGMHRAQALAEYLEDLGVGSEQLEVLSKGQTEPIASNKTNEGRARNRRATIEILRY